MMSSHFTTWLYSDRAFLSFQHDKVTLEIREQDALSEKLVPLNRPWHNDTRRERLHTQLRRISLVLLAALCSIKQCPC